MPNSNKAVLLDQFGRLVTPQKTRMLQAARQRYYSGASSDRNLYDFQANTVTADTALRSYVVTLRNRSRELERNSAWVRRWLSALENNVLGSDGINLQMKIRFNSGRYDKAANQIIEEAWTRWNRKETCTANAEDDWVGVQRLVLRGAARDGGIFIRKVLNKDLNEFGFALELIEADVLDEQYCDKLQGGNIVTNGVERNKYGRVVAYYMREAHPGASYPYAKSPYNTMRIPSTEMVHYFVKERPTQSIGVPWIAADMSNLHHLDQYAEAELMAARAAASKGGYFKSEKGDQFAGEEEVGVDVDGNVVKSTYNDFEPNSFDELPPGMEFVPYDPQHPNPPFNDFVRSMLFSICAGMDIDYVTLTGDLSQASFSSTKAGRLESQETFKKIQNHFITNFCIPVFTAWLNMAALSGNLGKLSMNMLEKYNQPRFRGRRWPWVDPVKDVDASTMALNAGLRTRTEIIAENGGDFEDVVEMLREEKEILNEAGLEFNTDNKPKKPLPAKQNEEAEPEEEAESGEEDKS